MLRIIHAILNILTIVVAVLFYVYSHKIIRVTGIDLVSIILGAVAILVTVLGVIVAIAALWGYKSILDEASDGAKQAAYQKLEKDLLPKLKKDLFEDLSRNFNTVTDNEDRKDDTIKQLQEN